MQPCVAPRQPVEVAKKLQFLCKLFRGYNGIVPQDEPRGSFGFWSSRARRTRVFRVSFVLQSEHNVS